MLPELFALLVEWFLACLAWNKGEPQIGQDYSAHFSHVRDTDIEQEIEHWLKAAQYLMTDLNSVHIGALVVLVLTALVGTENAPHGIYHCHEDGRLRLPVMSDQGCSKTYVMDGVVPDGFDRFADDALFHGVEMTIDAVYESERYCRVWKLGDLDVG